MESPDTRTADFLDSVMSVQATIELADALRDMETRVSAGDAETLQRASDWLAFMRGGLRAYESRLNGDLETVPDKALAGVVAQHFGDHPDRARVFELAQDVRLLCFFRAIERGTAHD